MVTLEIKTDGVEFVVSRVPQPDNGDDGQHKADPTRGVDLAELEAAFERAERARAEAADAEHAAYVRWLEAFGAYEAACDDAQSAWNALAGLVGRVLRPAGRWSA